MSEGRLQCSGSSLFLKSRLGLGYNMTMSLTPDADVGELSETVRCFVDGSTLLGVNGCEASYLLPLSQVDVFSDLIDEIEADKDAYGVRGYSISATTLEAVFLLVSGSSLREPQLGGSVLVEREDDDMLYEGSVWNCDFVEGGAAVRSSQARAMFVKRFCNGLRDRRMQFFQIVCPVGCILFAILLNMIDFSGAMRLSLDPSLYGSDVMMTTSGCENLLVDNFFNGGVDEKGYLNAQNLSWYLVDTWHTHPYEQYGALFCNDADLLSHTSGLRPMVHLYNTSTFHQAGISMTVFFNSIYRNLISPPLTGNKSMKWGVSVFPPTEWERRSKDALKTILMGAIIMIPFTFLPSNPVAWVVKERECKARHLQNVSGLRFYVYWGTNFVFDVVAYVVTMLLTIIIFLIFNRQEYVAVDRIGPTITLLLTYGFTSTSLGYLISFLFNEHSTAQMVVMAVSFVTGFLLVMVVYILSLLPGTSSVAHSFRFFARVLPTFCVGEGVVNLAILDIAPLLGWNWTPWGMETIGWACIYMAAEFPVFFFLTLFIDHPSRRRLGHQLSYKRQETPEIPFDEDSDVEAERERVQSLEGDETESPVSVINLRKVYGNGKVAVRNLTFGVKRGEVFGFLGPYSVSRG
ncbi:ATP-binding cassette protein subfamily A, member 5 [Trypanosoma grayi]|uniref:ATP-binding cassette protein subfamily A, member 5 n=1 Tax=Trypanosoma grayi TaxID=71804 RepID=UPI0004F477ED|nr:ATP-binding cassette protein subfamily A, member 5 [Trypanosoma grayi]KEG07295.1 ATP-binding cassette protein subfamily A, member 5 [Trypanosoma grayi]